MENLRHADYKVYFKPDYPFPPVPNPKELDIPEKYMSTETSGITFTLDESNAVFDFDITD